MDFSSLLGAAIITHFRAVVDKGEMKSDFVSISVDLYYNQMCKLYGDVTDLPLSILCCQLSILGWKKMSYNPLFFVYAHEQLNKVLF